MTKLKIDLKNGLLEVEGEDALVREIYKDYKDVLAHVISRQPETTQHVIDTPSPTEELNAPKENKKINKTSKSSRSKVMESYKILGDLNLTPPEKKSLKDFIAEKSPSEAGGEMTTVMVHYLQKTLGIENVSLNHIYTCYKNAEKKVPVSLKANVSDIQRRKGWLNTADTDKIRVTTSGENLVEHELPKKKKGSDLNNK